MSGTAQVTAPDLWFGVEDVHQTGGPGAAMTGSMVIDERHVGPDGRTSVGALGVLIDEILGYSLIGSLPPGSWTVSTELAVDLLAPLPTSGVLTGRGRTVQAGSYAVGEVVDEQGTVVAHCRERGRRIGEGPSLAAYRPPEVRGRGADGFLGLVPDGDVTRLEIVSGLENPRGTLHGGVSFAAAELVATRARLAEGCELATVAVQCHHTRTAMPGATVELRARTVHRGRTLWVSDVTGTVDGKTVVCARVTAQ